MKFVASALVLLATTMTVTAFLVEPPPQSHHISHRQEAQTSLCRVTTGDHLSLHQRLPLSRSSSQLSVLSTFEPPPHKPTDTDSTFPTQDKDGVYYIGNRQQHAAFLAANKDKIVVLKFFAPWCRACKAMSPKFVRVADDDMCKDMPVVFAEMSIQHNKEFVKEIGVLALPTVQFYVGGSLHDSFACGPSKVVIMKRKLKALFKECVNAETKQLKPTTETEPGKEIIEEGETLSSAPAVQQLAISPEERNVMRRTIPYFSPAEMSEADFDAVMGKAKLVAFDPGSTIFREGRRGRIFYVMKEGEVEIYQKTGSEDPLTMASSFLGTVINCLGPGDFFGERAMMTGEPRAASIRAISLIKCWTFDKDVFPASSALSGKSQTNGDMSYDLDDKYGLSFSKMYNDRGVKQITESSTANQVRGSPNSPLPIKGVDTADEIPDIDLLPASTDVNGKSFLYDEMNTDAIFRLLTRFQMVRHITRCFEYIADNKLRWGDKGSRERRSMLVRRLTVAKRIEFKELFQLVDTSNDGQISLTELKRVVESVGEPKSDAEVSKVISRSSSSEKNLMSMEDFMGIMAEAEFYYLFRDIFSSLDPHESGFVRAKDLDRVLSGVRDLISDDRKSIIDDSDEDNLLVDYEQFSRMLLGTSLV